MRWLDANPASCGDIMEHIVREMTRGGGVAPAAGAGAEDEQGGARNWSCRPVRGYEGRYEPDTVAATLQRGSSAKHDYDGDGIESFAEWLRYKTTQEVQTEVNVQLGAFTLRKCATRLGRPL